MTAANLVLPTTRSTSSRGSKPNSKGLANLIAKLNAAVAEVEKWSSREDRLSDQFRKIAGPGPSVKGGTTEPYTLVRDGITILDQSASDWFYQSRENILKDEEKALLDVTDEKQFSEIKARFAALLADWDAQEAEYNSKKPRGLAHAKRMLNKAHSAWSAAEDEIVNYRPRTLDETIDFVNYAGRDEMRGVFFNPEEGQLKFMMRNVGDVLAKLAARA